jgi:hypothetical protein
MRWDDPYAEQMANPNWNPPYVPYTAPPIYGEPQWEPPPFVAPDGFVPDFSGGEQMANPNWNPPPNLPAPPVYRSPEPEQMANQNWSYIPDLPVMYGPEPPLVYGPEPPPGYQYVPAIGNPIAPITWGAGVRGDEPPPIWGVEPVSPMMKALQWVKEQSAPTVKAVEGWVDRMKPAEDGEPAWANRVFQDIYGSVLIPKEEQAPAINIPIGDYKIATPLLSPHGIFGGESKIGQFFQRSAEVPQRALNVASLLADNAERAAVQQYGQLPETSRMAKDYGDFDLSKDWYGNAVSTSKEIPTTFEELKAVWNANEPIWSTWTHDPWNELQQAATEKLGSFSDVLSPEQKKAFSAATPGSVAAPEETPRREQFWADVRGGMNVAEARVKYTDLVPQMLGEMFIDPSNALWVQKAIGLVTKPISAPISLMKGLAGPAQDTLAKLPMMDALFGVIKASKAQAKINNMSDALENLAKISDDAGFARSIERVVVGDPEVTSLLDGDTVKQIRQLFAPTLFDQTGKAKYIAPATEQATRSAGDVVNNIISSATHGEFKPGGTATKEEILLALKQGFTQQIKDQVGIVTKTPTKFDEVTAAYKESLLGTPSGYYRNKWGNMVMSYFAEGVSPWRRPSIQQATERVAETGRTLSARVIEGGLTGTVPTGSLRKMPAPFGEGIPLTDKKIPGLYNVTEPILHARQLDEQTARATLHLKSYTDIIAGEQPRWAKGVADAYAPIIGKVAAEDLRGQLLHASNPQKVKEILSRFEGPHPDYDLLAPPPVPRTGSPNQVISDAQPHVASVQQKIAQQVNSPADLPKVEKAIAEEKAVVLGKINNAENAVATQRIEQASQDAKEYIENLKRAGVTTTRQDYEKALDIALGRTEPPTLRTTLEQINRTNPEAPVAKISRQAQREADLMAKAPETPVVPPKAEPPDIYTITGRKRPEEAVGHVIPTTPAEKAAIEKALRGAEFPVAKLPETPKVAPEVSVEPGVTSALYAEVPGKTGSEAVDIYGKKYSGVPEHVVPEWYRSVKAGQQNPVSLGVFAEPSQTGAVLYDLGVHENNVKNAMKKIWGAENVSYDTMRQAIVDGDPRWFEWSDWVTSKTIESQLKDMGLSANKIKNMTPAERLDTFRAGAAGPVGTATEMEVFNELTGKIERKSVPFGRKQFEKTKLEQELLRRRAGVKPPIVTEQVPATTLEDARKAVVEGGVPEAASIRLEVTNEGMGKGYYKIVDRETGNTITTGQSKKALQKEADEIMARGKLPGLSGSGDVRPVSNEVWNESQRALYGEPALKVEQQAAEFAAETRAETLGDYLKAQGVDLETASTEDLLNAHDRLFKDVQAKASTLPPTNEATRAEAMGTAYNESRGSPQFSNNLFGKEGTVRKRILSSSEQTALRKNLLATAKGDLAEAQKMDGWLQELDGIIEQKVSPATEGAWKELQRPTIGGSRIAPMEVPVANMDLQVQNVSGKSTMELRRTALQEQLATLQKDYAQAQQAGIKVEQLTPLKDNIDEILTEFRQRGWDTALPPSQAPLLGEFLGDEAGQMLGQRGQDAQDFIVQVTSNWRQRAQDVTDYLDDWADSIRAKIGVQPKITTPTSGDIASFARTRQQATQAFADLLGTADRKAQGVVGNVLFNYTEGTRGYEQMLGTLFPFVKFNLRSPGYWLEQASKTPKMGKVLSQYVEGTENPEAPLTSRFKYTVPIRIGDYTVGIDPSGIFSIAGALKEPYQDETASQLTGWKGTANDVLQIAGLGGFIPYPTSRLAAQILGLYGEQPYGDVLRTSPLARLATSGLPEPFRSGIGMLTGATEEDWIKRAAQNWRPFGDDPTRKNFLTSMSRPAEDEITAYYTRLELDKMVQDGKITETQALIAKAEKNDLYSQAQGSYQRLNDTLGAVRLFSPLGVKVQTPGERYIREQKMELPADATDEEKSAFYKSYPAVASNLSTSFPPTKDWKAELLSNEIWDAYYNKPDGMPRTKDERSALLSYIDPSFREFLTPTGNTQERWEKFPPAQMHLWLKELDPARAKQLEGYGLTITDADLKPAVKVPHENATPPAPTATPDTKVVGPPAPTRAVPTAKPSGQPLVLQGEGQPEFWDEYYKFTDSKVRSALIAAYPILGILVNKDTRNSASREQWQQGIEILREKTGYVPPPRSDVTPDLFDTLFGGTPVVRTMTPAPTRTPYPTNTRFPTRTPTRRR